ncbi:MAG: ATP-binding cassette domain-containing protein [Candidatus Egerieousia sp.]|nr:ATP-binding cassette domain-containing protein [bacterium]MDY5256087.1 ATP-binding cassette domain-containing protein [Candidatus Egerieousia sp.]
MIKIENLKFSYGSKSIFEGVSTELKPGMIYGLLGQNGVGKTTLLKLLAGLLKPQEGSCTIEIPQSGAAQQGGTQRQYGAERQDGAAMQCGAAQPARLIPHRRRPDFLEKVFYLPEDVVAPGVKIETYVKNTCSFYPNFSYEKFARIADEFKVETDCKFNKLSFGQQKKAFIAMALSMGTEVLLLDEPSNGLDIPSKIALRKSIAENITEEQTIIISTHQVKDLESIIDPIIILDHKGVLLNRSVEEISERLHFSLSANECKEALYSQQQFNGFLTIKENLNGEETKPDLEALFNCCLSNKERIKELFK